MERIENYGYVQRGAVRHRLALRPDDVARGGDRGGED
jgi:hypothetical protein